MVLKSTGNESPCKDIILKALTRLNEKSTLRVASDELSIIVRALDAESLAALVQSICTTTGAWEPKPVAKKECVRVLAQLPLPSCPVADVVLQQHQPKILAYLKRTLQDTDSLVREASSNALAAYTQGYIQLYGCAVPGSLAAPVVKVVFDCLMQQKKEGQMGASQALLKMAPYLDCLDKDLVKLCLKLLKSSAFLATAQLLAALASVDVETQMPVGVLKHGAPAFLPFLNHLIGQPSRQQTTTLDARGVSSGEGTAGSTASAASKASGTSGILGCLSSKEWAVRRAAADCLRATVLLLGPDLEPEGCWGLGDPGSVTGRCLDALEDCRFDKVKEAREAAREAMGLIHQLHRYMAEQGPDDGDAWHTWVLENLSYPDWHSPAQPAPSSPMTGRNLSSRGFGQHTSPITERFRCAALSCDVIAEPGQRQLPHIVPAAAAFDRGIIDEASELSTLEAELVPQVQTTRHDSKDTDLTAEASGVSNASSSCDAHQPEGLIPAAAAAAAHMEALDPSTCTTQRAFHTSSAGHIIDSMCLSRRASSCNGSRPHSAAGGSALGTQRRSSRQGEPAPLEKQSSTHSELRAEPSYAAGTKSSAAKGVAASQCPVLGAGRRACAARSTVAAWRGPTQQEWQQMQQQVQQQQQLIAQLQQQALEDRTRHAAEVQHLKASSAATCTALQERVTALELQCQRQQLLYQEQLQPTQQQQQFLTPTGPAHAALSSRRSPSKCTSSPASSSGMAAAAAVAVDSPVGGVLSLGAQQAMRASQQQGILSSDGNAASGRLHKSAEWFQRPGHSSHSARRVFVSPIDPSAGRLGYSCSGLLTPTSTSSGLQDCDTAIATPGDLESAYADALHNERGGVHLLRLIQKTGPVWGQLSTSTCKGLLEVFIKNVRDGVMLHRVLPWLWRLADDGAGWSEVPQGLQQQLLEALSCCPAAEDMQAQEKIMLLLDTLKTVWSL